MPPSDAKVERIEWRFARLIIGYGALILPLQSNPLPCLAQVQRSDSMDKHALIELATTRFGIDDDTGRRLSAADEVLFTAIASGGVADYAEGNPEADRLSGASDWPETRVIHADKLEWLCLDTQARQWITARGIQVRGVRIDGPVDLKFVRCPFPLSIWHSSIPEGVLLYRAELAGLHLDGTHVGPVKADGLTVLGTVALRNGFRAQGEFRLIGATITGDLDCRHGQFINPARVALNASKINVRGSAVLTDNFLAQGEVNFSGGRVGAHLECDGAQFFNQGTGGFNGDHIDVQGSAYFRKTFVRDTMISLRSATIGGNLEFDGSKLSKRDGAVLLLDGVNIEHDLRFRDDFTAEGQVSLNGARVRGNATFSDCLVAVPDNSIAVAAAGVVCEAELSFMPNVEIRGAVQLLNASVKSNVSLCGATVSNRGGFTIIGDGLRVGRGLFLSGIVIDGIVSLEGARVEDYFALKNARLSDDTVVILHSASAGTLIDDDSSWPKERNLFLDGFVYHRIHEDSPTDVRRRLLWIGRQPSVPFRPQPYEQLAKVLIAMGNDEDAKIVLVEKEDARRRAGFANYWQDRWHWFLGYTIGYGYRPLLALRIMFSFIVMSTAFFILGKHWQLFTPTDRSAVVSRWEPMYAIRYPKLNCLLYSIDEFIPVVNLRMGDYWVPNANAGRLLLNWPFELRTGSLLRIWLWVHIGAGWFLTSLLVAGLVGLIKK